MKIKSAACSTGHGTGVTPPIELTTIIARDRMRLKLTQVRRAAQMAEKRFRHGKAQVSGGELA